jgi:plasmid stability protein
MVNIQVRDVPDDVQAELVRRAKAAGQSLQQYLRALLIAAAGRPDPNEYWAQLGERLRRSGGANFTGEELAEVIRAMREGRSS